MQVANRHNVIAMTDAAGRRALVGAERPHLVVPEVEAIATDELAAIEAAGLATVIPTARAAQLTMNREGIRRLAAEALGLPTSAYAFASTEAELAKAAAEVTGFPCFVKPVMSSSGKGQSYVETPGEIAAAWRCALEGGRVEQPRVIVEGRVDFDFEITQLTVRSLGADGATVTSFCDPIGHRQVKGDYVESWQPQAITPAALARSREIAKAVTDALGGQGVFGVELFVRGDEVWFSEVSPRPTTPASSRSSPNTERVAITRAISACRWMALASPASAVITAGWRPGHRLRGRRRRARRTRRRLAPVRQAGELHAGAGARPRGRRRGPARATEAASAPVTA